MSFRTKSPRTRLAALLIAVTAGAAAIAPATPAQANDAFAAGVLGGLVGAALFPPAYPVYAAPPVYVAPAPVYVEPAPAIVYEEPVYVAPQPVYVEPAYVVPAYPARRSLAEIEAAPPRYTRPQTDGPRVLTYEETVGGGTRVAGTEPWSPAWYDYCRSKFRTFDDQTGTFMGFDGQRHFCTVK